MLNKDGLFIEKPSLMDKFERKDTSENPYIEELTYTQLAMKYVSSNAEPKQKEFMSTVVKEVDEGFNITDQMDLIESITLIYLLKLLLSHVQTKKSIKSMKRD